MHDDGIDRISSLPDHVLEHILSFLTTRQVVKTCILSKRWRNTWAYVPALEFDFDEFKFSNAGWYRTPVERKKSFERFVDDVFDKRGRMHLNRFQLKCSSCIFNSRVLIKWLCYALLLKPKSIDIKIITERDLLPDSLFCCESMQNLQVEVLSPSNKLTPKTKSINLPYLKCLRLCAVRLGDDFKTMLFQGCPLLEDLALDYCKLDLFEISSKMLKKLAIINCYQYKKLNISCPGIVSFVMAYFIGRMREELSISYMPSLINADFSFSYISNYYALKLVRSCSNATSLTFLVEHLSLEVENVYKFNIFDKLKCLRIGWNRHANFDMMAYFLQHSPRLQELILQLPRTWDYPLIEANDWKKSSEVILLREYLDSITIENRHGSNSAMIDQLLRDLRASVSTIGKVVVIPPQQ